jgi:6,7-dimethyl-8-ribityllumazine synthase
MSDQPIEWDLDAKGLKFAIVVARFNAEITAKLLEGARGALEKSQADTVDVFKVPGSFELPLAAKQLALTGRYDGIVALGCVIRGETPHFDFVAATSASGILDVMLETSVPIAFGVLTTNTVEQAQARADGNRGNKGFDAAMTAIEMVRFGRKISEA